MWACEGWLYMAVVLDLYLRRVVGWSMKSRMTADLVADALIIAVWRRRPSTDLLHHWDQSSQHTSEDFQRGLAEHGIACSLNGRGISGTMPRWKASFRVCTPNGRL